MRGKPRKSRENACRQHVLGGFLAVSGLLFAMAAYAQAPPAKAVGTVTSISGNSVVLATDNSSETTITFTDSARIVKAAPGQIDLKSATPIELSDIQIGDRVAARGQSTDNGSLTASLAIVMKQGDIAQRQQSERDEWRRGVGGIVKEVNAQAGTVSISNSLAAGGKPILIHVGPGVDIKRYAPDSVKFDDAKVGTLDQVKPGDQLRARGSKNADGTEFTAQAIVSGSFKDIAGTVVSTDAARGSINITDLATKKPVTIRIAADSQLRKLPQPLAMGLARRLKGEAPGAPGQGGETGTTPTNDSGAQGQGNAGQGNRRWQGSGGEGGPSGSVPGARGEGNWRRNGNGPPDFQQMLARMPALSVSELNKGDAVILVATEGSAGVPPTAITLLSGVEPILSAAPSGAEAASTILSPWNLGAPSGAGGDASQ
jgi:hypothetical protein